MERETFVGNAPTLETERLVLRPLSEADVDALHRVSNEPLVRRYPWDNEQVSRADIEEVVAAGANEPNTISLRVIEKLGMRPAGGISPSQPGVAFFALDRDHFLARDGRLL